MTRHSRAALRLLLLAAVTLPTLAGHGAAASSSLPPLPVPTLLTRPQLLPHPATLPNRAIFTYASARSGVPITLLLALSYVQSFWGDHGGRPSVDGGYGLMDLVHNAERDTLGAAARLLHVSAWRVAHDDALNVLGGALLLARAARALAPRHRLPASLGGWAGAIVWLTGMRTRLAAGVVVRDVYRVLSHGASLRDLRGRLLRLAAAPGIAPDMRSAAPLLAQTDRGPRAAVADYPAAQWAPSPNYTAADRPSDLSIEYVVIHDTEGGCAASLSWLDNPGSRASAHFLVCQDGTVYQLVRVHNVAWHAGNWYINQHSIGIEHEGYRDAGGYTQAQYDVSAAILRWLNRTYHLGLALDRNSIFGHENVPNANHTDPGPFWDWAYFMRQLRGGSAFDGGDPTVAMVAAPRATLYSCPDPTCTVMGTANWGEQFAVAASQSGWDEVYYNGAAAWISGSDVTNGSGTRLRVTPSRLKVRDEPSTDGAVIGTIPRGQVYVSRLLDWSLDPAGWWLIAYNHRYGFVSNGDVQALPGAFVTATPTPYGATPTATASATVMASATATSAVTLTASCVPSITVSITPTVTVSPTMTVTATPTITATPTVTATASITPTATVADMWTSPVTSTAVVTAVVTATPTATASPTTTPTPTATATASPTTTPTPTETPSPLPTCALRPLGRIGTTSTALKRSPSGLSRRAAKPLRLSTLTVQLARPHLRPGNPLRFRVHTNVGRASLQYRVSVPRGIALRATGHTDRRGNAGQAFILPSQRWLTTLLGRARRKHRWVAVALPHSVQATYTVTVSWRRHTIARRGKFRIVLWGHI